MYEQRDAERKGEITVNNKSNLLEDIYAYYWSNVKSNLFLGMIIVPLSYIFALVVFFTLVLGKKSIPKLAILVLACFLPIFCILYAIKLYARFINFIRSINEHWPTEAEQLKLRDDFAGSRSVCNGAMRIGYDYSYFLMEHQIIDTQKIVSFRSEEKHFSKGSAMYIYAVIDNSGTQDSEVPDSGTIDTDTIGSEMIDSETSPVRRDLYVTAAKNQKGADALINEATFALRSMQ